MVELKPGGAGVKVTDSNKREYVNLIAAHHMTTAIKPQLTAFLQVRPPGCPLTNPLGNTRPSISHLVRLGVSSFICTTDCNLELPTPQSLA